MFSIKRFAICFTFLVATTSSGFPQAKLTPEQWREDLRYFATNLQKTHRNLFHTMTRQQFESAVKKLDERIPTLADHEIIVELMRIVAAIGDGHTGVRVTQQFKSVYPLRLYYFKDGLFVQSAAAEYQEAVGGRVLRIGNADTEQALRAVSEIAWRDNEQGVKAIAPRLLVIPEVLHALRIADDLQKTTLIVEKNGQRNTLELKPAGQLMHLLEGDPSGWVDARNESKTETPLWLRDPHNNFWFEHLTGPKAACAQGCERGIAYVQFNAVQDRPQAGDKPGETVEAFFNRVFDYIETNKIDKLVLDMRLNGGGNNFLNLPLTIGMIKSRVNKRGNLFVIIGRETFSAAQNTVNELEKYTNAIFVGEPTAANPNHFGDARNVVLPNSKITIRASTLWWQDMDPRDTRKWTAPQLAAELTFADYKANIDPAMTAILKFVPGNGLSEQLTNALKSGGYAAASKAFRAFRENPAHTYLEPEA
ncbi:MAG TPA: hypothetical protein VFR80_08035, partial [Pyrinomonadaceae bacterium]|nr:hypothetical protein [Pyrinomonadaceae bacterium]